MRSSRFGLLHERIFPLAPLRDIRRDRVEADRRSAKPYNIVLDISTHGSGQGLGGAYLVKTDGTDGTGIIIGIHIIGSKLGRRSNLKTYRERKATAAGPAFLSIIQCRHGFRTKRRFDRGAHIEHVREAVCSIVLNKKELYIMFCDRAATSSGTKANGL